MKLMKTVRHYKKRLERHFDRRVRRQQLNFPCTPDLITALRLLAWNLKSPLYPVAEHALQLGLAEMAAVAEDSAEKEELQRHLLRQHLLVDHVDPMEAATSRRLQRIKSARRLLDFIDFVRGPEEAARTVDALVAELGRQGVTTPGEAPSPETGPASHLKQNHGNKDQGGK